LKPEAALAIAARFVRARLTGQPLAAYPGDVPQSADDAYACQDAAITMWPEPVAGWKVGLVAPDATAEFGDARLVGPIFKGLLKKAGTGVTPCAMFAGGFAAVEAEFIFRIARNAPDTKFEWSTSEAAALVASMHVGVEIASSPLATINELGPTVIASDFGNNFGLIVGHEISQWQSRPLDSLRCETSIDGKLAGTGSAASVPGGPLASLAFALSRCARRGYPLRAGQYVCTGATTGVHKIRSGEVASIWFHDIGTIMCQAVAAQLHPTGASV
jgi:2-keto-4-pentenoate hydratase